MKQNEAMLSQYKANNADLEKDVERLEQRKKLLEKVWACRYSVMVPAAPTSVLTFEALIKD